MNYLTDTEKDVLELLLSVREYMTGPQQYKKLYVETITDVRDMIAILENKKFGCVTGKHSGNCHCVVGAANV